MRLDSSFDCQFPCCVAFYTFVYQPNVDFCVPAIKTKFFATIKFFLFIAFAAVSDYERSFVRYYGPCNFIFLQFYSPKLNISLGDMQCYLNHASERWLRYENREDCNQEGNKKGNKKRSHHFYIAAFLLKFLLSS